MKVIEHCRYKRKRAADRQLVHHFMINQVHIILFLLSRHSNSMTPQQKELNSELNYIFQSFLKREKMVFVFFFIKFSRFLLSNFSSRFCHTYVHAIFS